MRVISGTARGRRLTPPADRRVRPTSDRIKEALFSILHSLSGDFEGMSVLDLFAGTGNLGIEALSRGADKAVFVDNNKTSINLIRTNLQLTGFSGLSEIIYADALQSVMMMADRGSKFDLVFADPPYDKGLAAMLLSKLPSDKLLNEGAVVVIETGSKEMLNSHDQLLKQIDRRIYADTALTLFKFKD